MMVKVILITSILLILIALIPYWTDIKAKQQLHQFNQDCYSAMNFQITDIFTDYKYLSNIPPLCTAGILGTPKLILLRY
jgi:hypothetical protein